VCFFSKLKKCVSEKDDILGDMNVGFFSMIDTTDARLDVKK
jgi:hypothetical protein